MAVGEIGKITKTLELNELPEDVRAAFAPGKPVTAVFEGEFVEPEPAADAIEARQSSLLRFWGAAADRNTSIEEAVARVRELRDEWD